MASPWARSSHSPIPARKSGRGFREATVGPCSIQTPGDRYDDPTAAEVIRDREEAPQSGDWMDSESEDEVVPQEPDQITTENPWKGPGLPPLEQRIPTTQRARNNLTAMSQRYNLYFAAYGNRIFVYRTHAPRILLAAEPDLILATSPDAIAQRIQPSQDAYHPHQSNAIRTGFLGHKEILALVYDDGSVYAFYVDNIAAYIERGPDSRPSAVPTPFFKDNAGAPAWGLAIHQASRLIAVSTNKYEVVVFAFGLTHYSVPPAKAALPTVAARFACRRSRSCRIVLFLGPSVDNIPNISFLDGQDGAAEKICAIDIKGAVWILDIWRSCAPVRISAIQDGTSPSGGTGWDVLVLPHTSFVAANCTQDALGLCQDRVRFVNDKADITTSLRAVPDNPAAADPTPVWTLHPPGPFHYPDPQLVLGQVAFGPPQPLAQAEEAIAHSQAEAVNTLESDLGSFDSDDPDSPENPAQHYLLDAPSPTSSLHLQTSTTLQEPDWGALSQQPMMGFGALSPNHVYPGHYSPLVVYSAPGHTGHAGHNLQISFDPQMGIFINHGSAPGPAPASAPSSAPSPISGSPPFPPGLRTILPPTPPAPILDDAEYFGILDAFPEDIVYLPDRGAILGLPNTLHDRLRFFQRRSEHNSSKTTQDLTADRLSRCAILRTYSQDIELVNMEPGLCNVMIRKPAGQPERPGHLHRMVTHRLNMTLHVPELSLVIVGSPLGRVILLTPTRINGRPIAFKPRSSLKYGFRVDCVLPRASEERDRRLPRRNLNLLYGIAVAPAPEASANTTGKGSLHLRRHGSRRKTALGPGTRRYRLVLHYHSHIIITYDLSRDDDGALQVF